MRVQGEGTGRGYGARVWGRGQVRVRGEGTGRGYGVRVRGEGMGQGTG